MQTGLIQAYCGSGKGKTTAAIGQGIRAVGRDMKVIMIQFLKGGISGELKTLTRLEPDFKVFRFEKDRGFYPMLTSKEKDDVRMEVENALKFANKIFETEECDLLILDEIFGVVENGIISEQMLEKLLLSKPVHVELVLTGRVVPESVKVHMDYISQIDAVKHPYDVGVGAREGIEY